MYSRSRSRCSPVLWSRPNSHYHVPKRPKCEHSRRKWVPQEPPGIMYHPGDMWGACELNCLLWGVNIGVNIPKCCEMTYSHLRQRACPDSPGPVLHPGDVWEVPGYFYPSCSGVQGAVKSKTFLCLFTVLVRTRNVVSCSGHQRVDPAVTNTVLLSIRPISNI